jgi:hypothetical protein
MYEMTLKDEWDRLDTKTRQWLLDNPGCVMVPRTVASMIQRNCAGHVEVDGHGQMILSREDLDFIRDKGRGVTEPVGEEFRFFDAAQPVERP